MERERINKKDYFILGIAALLLVVVFLFDDFNFSSAESAPVSSSVEVGVASVSPKGVSAGLAIPASCPSDLHDAPANYGQSCASGANVCGMTNTGSIQCNGACSASTPPLSACFPSISISQSSSATNQGLQYTISWSTNDSTSSCVAEERVPSGSYVSWATSVGNSSKSASSIPSGTYQYRAQCTNTYGSSSWASLSHSVNIIPPTLDIAPSMINRGETVDIDWSCNPAVTDISFGGGFNTNGTIFGSTFDIPLSDTTYTIQCETSSGIDTGFRTTDVTVLIPTLGITATPPLVQEGDSATVSWNAFGVNSCTVTGTDGFTDTSGDLSGGVTYSGTNVTAPLVNQTTYTLTCDTGAEILVEKVIINVNPIFEEF